MTMKEDTRVYGHTLFQTCLNYYYYYYFRIAGFILIGNIFKININYKTQIIFLLDKI